VADGRRIVIKVGSSTLASSTGGLDLDYIRNLVDQVASLVESGWNPVLVSSGAIAAGIEVLGLASRPSDMPSLQAAASIGQVRILQQYSDMFDCHHIPIGQILLTRRDTAHRPSYLNAKNTFDRLISLGIVPIVNENDSIAVEEIRFGDNDTLAALVAVMIEAEMVLLLTDIEGLYTSDPRHDAEAELLTDVDQITDSVLEGAGGAGTTIGSGGMATKVKAAQLLMRAGIPLVVCDGRRPGVILAAAEGEAVGTRFATDGDTISARKLWIAMGGSPSGAIIIDDGARQAILTRGSSLLPAGVIRTEGSFLAGDTVILKDQQGNLLAQGLVGISSADLDVVKGLKSTQILQDRPSVAGREVVHRDHLVVF